MQRDRTGGGGRVGREALHHVAGQRRDVGVRQLQRQVPAGQLRDVEHAVDQRGQSSRLARDGVHPFLLRGRHLHGRSGSVLGGHVALDRLDVQQHRGEGRAQLVGGDGQELVARGDGRLRDPHARGGAVVGSGGRCSRMRMRR